MAHQRIHKTDFFDVFFIFYKSVRGAPAHFWPYCIFLVFGLLVPNIYDNLLFWICQKVALLLEMIL